MAAALIVARVWYIRIKTGRAGLGQENSQMHPLVGMRAILSYCLSSSALVSLPKLKRLLQKPGFAKKLVVSTDSHPIPEADGKKKKEEGRPKNNPLSLARTFLFLPQFIGRGKSVHAHTVHWWLKIYLI